MELKTSEELPDYKSAMSEVYYLYGIVYQSETWFDTYLYDITEIIYPEE